MSASTIGGPRLGVFTHNLLSIVELGGYPNLSARYSAAGYQVIAASSMRKALGLLKRHQPRVIVAEFNYQSDFRDRTSNLDSLLATLQTRCPEARVIVLYEQGDAIHLERLLGRFPVFATLSFPVDQDALMDALQRAALA